MQKSVDKLRHILYNIIRKIKKEVRTMKTITKLQNGQTQVAQAAPEEFKNLKFKFYDKAPELLEDVECVKVYFNKKQEVVKYKAIQKFENISTNIFKKEALKKNGTLKAGTIKTLNSLS